VKPIGTVLQEASARFERAGIDTSRVDAEWLIAGILGVNRSQVRIRAN
jgi:methylase of polypeptide subunit release factors